MANTKIHTTGEMVHCLRLIDRSLSMWLLANAAGQKGHQDGPHARKRIREAIALLEKAGRRAGDG